MSRQFYLILFLSSLLASCSSKYHSFRDQYQFKSNDGSPQYSNLDYWAAHPWKWDPSDSIPAPLQSGVIDSTVDVFFIHPTTHTSRTNKKEINASIDDDRINAKTDYSTILYQASVFNQEARVFAPRYRQAHLSNFYNWGETASVQAFDLAYEDIRNSFQYYLSQWNKGRPLIIASHSQGSVLAERLLKEFFDDKPLQNRLVVAYIVGWGLPKDYFSSLKMCIDSLQTGCICAWRTVRKGYVPRYIRKEKENSLVTNPITWTTGEEYASEAAHKGSVLADFNKVHYNTTDAQIKNGLLYISKPEFPGSFFYFTRNYHIADINLFYINIRENVSRRIGMFWKK